MTRRPPVQAHHHGTLTGYTNGCRCSDCTAANTRKQQSYRRRRAYGRPAPTDRVPIGPSQETLRRLYDAGYTDNQLARLCGLTNQQTNRIRQRGSWVTVETAERIARGAVMAKKVPPRDLLAERYVDAVGARRRVQALMTIGWGVEQLGVELGHSGGYLSPLLYSGRQITPRLDQAVRDLYERLWNTTGPSSSTRLRSLKRGWATPLELDDERIDDPTYVPVLHRLTPAVDRKQRREQAIATVAQLSARGISAEQIARHAGITSRTVVRIRQQLREAS